MQRASRAGWSLYHHVAGPLRGSRAAYAANLAATDIYAQASKGAPFVKLSPQDQDAVLTDTEKNVATGFRPNSGTFFNLVRTHTIQARQGQDGAARLRSASSTRPTRRPTEHSCPDHLPDRADEGIDE